MAVVAAEADLHCHRLPTWNDGLGSRDEAFKMAARAAQSGLKTILVTPPKLSVTETGQGTSFWSHRAEKVDRWSLKG